jgi:hypothetical protein
MNTLAIHLPAAKPARRPAAERLLNRIRSRVNHSLDWRASYNWLYAVGHARRDLNALLRGDAPPKWEPSHAALCELQRRRLAALAA